MQRATPWRSLLRDRCQMRESAWTRGGRDSCGRQGRGRANIFAVGGNYSAVQWGLIPREPGKSGRRSGVYARAQFPSMRQVQENRVVSAAGGVDAGAKGAVLQSSASWLRYGIGVAS